MKSTSKFTPRFCVNIPVAEVRSINMWHYKLMMIKMKISYMAWEKNIDIFELFIQAIGKTLE